MFADDWSDVIFNPSFFYRFTHMMVACLITASVLVAGVSAWRVIKQVDGPATNKVLRVAVIAAAILVPTQIMLGDLHSLNTLKHQTSQSRSYGSSLGYRAWRCANLVWNH